MSKDSRLTQLETAANSKGGILFAVHRDDEPGVYTCNRKEYTRAEIEEMAKDYADVIIFKVVHE